MKTDVKKPETRNVLKKKQAKKPVKKEENKKPIGLKGQRKKETTIKKALHKKRAEPKPESSTKKKKEIVYAKPQKPGAVKRKQQQLKKKKKHPIFRGRFGNKNVRKISKERWNKWRKPRGIDIKRKKEDGAWPMAGYQNDARIRGFHPSGYIPVYVQNMHELEALLGQSEKAAIIAGTIGRKKRREMLKKASKHKIMVLNRGK